MRFRGSASSGARSITASSARSVCRSRCGSTLSTMRLALTGKRRDANRVSGSCGADAREAACVAATGSPGGRCRRSSWRSSGRGCWRSWTWLAPPPRPGIYLRQVDVPGVHTKLIEAHRGVLAELLDLALPPECHRRRSTRRRPVCRALRLSRQADPHPLPRARRADHGRLLRAPARAPIAARIWMVRAHSRDRCDVRCASRRSSFITENETNFLAFPPVADALVIFGAGYGWDALARADWLAAAGSTTGATSTPTDSPSSTSCAAGSRTSRRS